MLGRGSVFTVTPKTKMKQVTLMLKAIHAQESKEAAREKAASIAAKLREMKLLSAAKKVEESVGEILAYMDFLPNTGVGSARII